MNYILAYWNEIEIGACVVSKRIRKVYARLAERIRSPQGDYIYSDRRAEKPIAFIEEFCRHSKGEWAGKPVVLELHQKAFISALFGFIHKETGLRQYRETLFYVARKNGKSTLLAGLALYMLIMDGEPGAEVYSAATKRDQAKRIFDETHNMVKQDQTLRRHVHKRKGDLYFTPGMSWFQPLGRDSDTLDGLNAHCIIIDELHAIHDRNLYEVLQQSQSARRQPLLIMITTAGTVRECIFDEMYDYACKIADGVIEDETFLPILYELDSREEWTDRAAWPKANPALGTVKKLESLITQVLGVEHKPNSLTGILVKDFNIRDTVGGAWLNYDEINNEETFDIEQFRNCIAIGGADFSQTTDLTCATLLLIDKETEKRYVLQMYWLPADRLETRVKVDKIPYNKWHEQKLLRLCTGNSISYHDVTAWYIEMENLYGITPQWVYYDRYAAKYWVEEMEAENFTMIPCAQGVKTLSLPMQQMGADLQAKKINYNNHPILKWCLTNTAIETDRNGNIAPVKVRSAKQRIDGTASLLDAYVGLMDHYNEFLEAI